MPHAPLRLTPRLVALTAVARAAIGREQVIVDHVPFAVGRESRLMHSRGAVSVERRQGAAAQVNDLYLVEQPGGRLLQISREHFLIDFDHDRFFLTDRRSVCGTCVGGHRVGGGRLGGRAELRDQDVIIVGTPTSPFVFLFRTM